MSSWLVAQPGRQPPGQIPSTLFLLDSKDLEHTPSRRSFESPPQPSPPPFKLSKQKCENRVRYPLKNPEQMDLLTTDSR